MVAEPPSLALHYPVRSMAVPRDFVRHDAGGSPTPRLNARLNAASDRGAPQATRSAPAAATTRLRAGTPSAEAAHAVHREAHGLVAEEIYEVEEHQ